MKAYWNPLKNLNIEMNSMCLPHTSVPPGVFDFLRQNIDSQPKIFLLKIICLLHYCRKGPQLEKRVENKVPKVMKLKTICQFSRCWGNVYRRGTSSYKIYIFLWCFQPAMFHNLNCAGRCCVGPRAWTQWYSYRKELEDRKKASADFTSVLIPSAYHYTFNKIFYSHCH